MEIIENKEFQRKISDENVVEYLKLLIEQFEHILNCPECLKNYQEIQWCLKKENE